MKQSISELNGEVSIRRNHILVAAVVSIVCVAAADAAVAAAAVVGTIVCILCILECHNCDSKRTRHADYYRKANLLE